MLGVKTYNSRPDPFGSFPHDGFSGGVKIPKVLPEKTVITRYGNAGGNFGSIGEPAFETRALPGIPSDYPPLLRYRVKVGKTLDVDYGRASPAFNQPGGANQIMVKHPVTVGDISFYDLLQLDIIEVIP